MNGLSLSFLTLFVGFVMSPQGEKPDPRCGSRCLLVALKAMGEEKLTLTALEASLGPPSEKGYSLEELSREATRRGLHTLGVETTLENLRARDKPFACITLTNGNHFVLLYDIDSDSAYLVDPPRHNPLPLDTFATIWSKKCLLISNSPLVDELELNRRVMSRQPYWILLVVAGFLAIGIAIFLIRRSRSKTAMAAAFVLVSALFSGCGPSKFEKPTDATATPDGGLVFEPPLHELGDLTKTSLDSTCEAKTVIRNTGSRAVRILELVKSCSCTTTKLSSDFIEPGASAELIAGFRPGNSEELRAATIDVRTDDPRQPVKRIVYHWRVRNILHANPHSVSLGKIRPGEPARSRVELVASDSVFCEKCKFKVVSKVPELSVDLQTNDVHAPPPNSAAREIVVGSLDVKLAPGFEIGSHSQILEVTLSCKGERKAVLDFPVNWSIVTDFQVIPARISLGLVPPGKDAKVQIVVKSERESHFQVRGAKLDADSALIRFEGGEKPKSSHVCKLVVRVPDKAGIWSSILTLETDDPDIRFLKIPISALVEPTR